MKEKAVKAVCEKILLTEIFLSVNMTNTRTSYDPPLSPDKALAESR
jgi:hypothetical protein